MTTDTPTFVEGDTASVLRVTCKNKSGAVIDLSGATVDLRWKNRAGALVEQEMSVLSPATNGLAEYQFGASELEPDLMSFEVQITTSGGDVMTGVDPIYEHVRKKLS